MLVNVFSVILSESDHAKKKNRRKQITRERFITKHLTFTPTGAVSDLKRYGERRLARRKSPILTAQTTRPLLMKNAAEKSLTLDDASVKNKKDGRRKTGKKLVEKFVTPVINQARKEKTGAPADSTEGRQDLLAAVDRFGCHDEEDKMATSEANF